MHFLSNMKLSSLLGKSLYFVDRNSFYYSKLVLNIVECSVVMYKLSRNATKNLRSAFIHNFPE